MAAGFGGLNLQVMALPRSDTAVCRSSLSALGENVPDRSSLFLPTTKLSFLHKLEPRERVGRQLPFSLVKQGWQELRGRCHG